MPSSHQRADEISAHRPRRPTPHKWELDRNGDDLRGLPVVDRTGRRLGRVTHMYVDPETKHLVEVELDEGERLPARDLVLGEQLLTLTTRPEPNPQPVVITSPPEPEPAPSPQPRAPPVLRSVPASPEPAPRKSTAQAARDDRDVLIVQLLDK